ncbi:MAG: hypothetical protein CMJ18_21440 [Phycisphaeraceae bacterium]|nr:hypothetical protein [Phycisphaeraceae bacterium]
MPVLRSVLIFLRISVVYRTIVSPDCLWPTCGQQALSPKQPVFYQASGQHEGPAFRDSRTESSGRIWQMWLNDPRIRRPYPATDTISCSR